MAQDGGSRTGGWLVACGLVAVAAYAAGKMTGGGQQPQPLKTVAPEVPQAELHRYATRLEWFNCQVDQDCVSVPADCCGCASGGRNLAVNSNFLLEAAKQRTSECPTIRCSPTRSGDPTCRARARCENGACQLAATGQPPPRPASAGRLPGPTLPPNMAPNPRVQHPQNVPPPAGNP